MKLKYFLRGVGVGIIFGSLIMLVAYLTSGAGKLSDKEIIERAENLGMVMEEDMVITGSNDEAKKDTDKTTEDSSEATEEIIQDSDISIEGVVDGSIENSTTEDDATEEITTEEVTTEATTENTTEKTDSSYVTAKISVTRGMSSSQIAFMLQEAGIIDDYEDFDAYLNENGYSTQLKINDYEFNSNMTYEELALELIKEDKIEN